MNKQESMKYAKYVNDFGSRWTTINNTGGTRPFLVTMKEPGKTARMRHYLQYDVALAEAKQFMEPVTPK